MRAERTARRRLSACISLLSDTCRGRLWCRSLNLFVWRTEDSTNVELRRLRDAAAVAAQAEEAAKKKAEEASYGVESLAVRVCPLLCTRI